MGRQSHEATLPVCGEGERCSNVLGLQVWKIGENLFFGHAGRQVFQDIVDGYPQPSNAWFSAPLLGVYGDDIGVISKHVQCTLLDCAILA